MSEESKNTDWQPEAEFIECSVCRKTWPVDDYSKSCKCTGDGIWHLINDMEQARREIKQLRAWKQEMLIVSKQLDTHALAKMLGGRIGESCAIIINKEVPKLLAENRELKRKLRELYYRFC